MLINIRELRKLYLVMEEHAHGINLHLSAYPPVSDLEVLIKTAVRSVEFFVRNPSIKFSYHENKDVKGNLKKNVSNLFSKVKGELKKFSISGMMKKFTIKKTDKYSNVKLETISSVKDEIDVNGILECIDSTLEVIGNMIET